jgi:hypothetical protein
VSETLTSDELQRRHIQLLGADLGPVYDALYHECAWLHVKWHQYVQLFGTKPERLDLLNRSAGRFFQIVQDAFLDDILLHIARLTDHPGGEEKTNLSLRSLPALISNRKLRSETRALIKAAMDASAFAHDWRNRRIAHRDLALKLDKLNVTPLTPASRKRIKDAIAALCRVIEHINSFYFGSDLRLSLITETITQDVISLLYVIRDGLNVEEQRRQRIRERRFLPSDFLPQDEI